MNNLFLSIIYLVNLLICILLDINYKKNRQNKFNLY